MTCSLPGNGSRFCIFPALEPAGAPGSSGFRLSYSYRPYRYAHGSIINKDYGSSFRLAAVLTDVALIPTLRVSYNVDDFCMRCQVCCNACPPDAILPDKTMVRGETKWYVDFDKCIPFFNENLGCAIFIAVCPWSIPGRGPRIVEQLLRRSSRKGE